MNKKNKQKQEQIEDDIRKFSTLVYNLAYSYTKSVSDSEDIFQDVFIKYYKHFDKLTNDDHKENWLKIATKHTTINFMKIKNKNEHLELNESVVADLRDYSLADVEESKLSQIIQYLRKSYRVVLDLYYCKNLHVKEISKSLNLTENAVKTRLKRGRQELKEIVNKVGF